MRLFLSVYSIVEVHATTEAIELAKFALIEINRSTKILPNISLGYVFTDTCQRDLTSVARALYFIPQTNKTVAKNKAPIVEECGAHVQYYPVVGVIGPQFSKDAVMVAPLLSLAHIPVLSPVATSDELVIRQDLSFSCEWFLPTDFRSKL